MIARRLGFLSAGLVAAASGTYLFVYLYRWEWNRALIAGIFFIAAEIAIGIVAILDRLQRIEQRLEERPVAEALRHIEQTAPERRVNFEWLKGEGLGVFVPVLMGAGILFSGIAWLIERFAHATARPVLERSLAVRLAPLALPAGGFLGEGATGAPPTPPPSTMATRYRTIFILLVVTGLLFMTIDQLGDLTQNRPDPDLVGRTSAITLQIERHGFTRDDVTAARSLWHSCSGTVSRKLAAKGFVSGGDGTVTMLISPAPGSSAQKRLYGCLEDATIDNMSARVVGSVLTVP